MLYDVVFPFSLLLHDYGKIEFKFFLQLVGFGPLALLKSKTVIRLSLLKMGAVPR